LAGGGATAGDLITTVSFFVSSVLNAIPATAGSVGTTYLAAGSVTQTILGTNVAGNGPAFSAYQSTPQTITNSTFTLVTFTTEEFDTNNNFASSSFTPTVAGYYQLNAQVNNSATVSLSRQVIVIYKNGSAYKLGTDLYPSAQTASRGVISTLVYANGSTDYFQVYCFVTGSGTITTVDNTTQDTWFNGSLVRSA
jgi:hypothetical protein